MKKYLALLLLATTFFVGASVNAEDIRTDGNWWLNRSRIQKLDYMLAFWGGEQEESNVWDGALLFSCGKKYDKNCISFMQHIEKTANVMHSGVKATAGQLVDGIDSLYSDYRNRLILVPHAIRIVRSSIDGASDDIITKMTEKLRERDSQEK